MEQVRKDRKDRLATDVVQHWQNEMLNNPYNWRPPPKGNVQRMWQGHQGGGGFEINAKEAGHMGRHEMSRNEALGLRQVGVDLKHKLRQKGTDIKHKVRHTIDKRRGAFPSE